MSEERRVHQRVAGGVPCLLKTSAGEEAQFDLVDLSESGARIRCSHALSAMTEIGVSLELPAQRIGADDPVQFETRGVVVWSHPTGDGRFDTGVFFSELNTDSRALLQAYVLSSV